MSLSMPAKCFWIGALTVSALIALRPCPAKSAEEYHIGPGKHEIGATLFEWQDEGRRRRVPVKLYFPQTNMGRFPVIVFSHGLGGSREGYAYLGRYWAAHGYFSLHLQHPGSDDSVWRGELQPREALRRVIADPRNSLDRVMDVRFALDQMEKLNCERGPFQGRMDLDKVGMAGHSFGAWTTQAVAGEVFFGPAGKSISWSEPRIRAAVIMSPSPPRQRDKLEEAFAGIKIPCLHMTGTLDDSPLGDTSANERRLPFDHIRGAEQYLITFIGGDHMIFSGRGLRAKEREKDAMFQRLICISSTAFWDAYLKGDEQAKAFLADGLKRLLADAALLERRNAAK